MSALAWGRVRACGARAQRFQVDDVLDELEKEEDKEDDQQHVLEEVEDENRQITTN